MSSALETLAVYAASLCVDRLPADVVGRAKTCLVDALFGCFVLDPDPRSQAAVRAVPVDRGSCRIVGTAHTAAPADAAFVNAVASACTDRSDTHRPTAVHPGLAVVPAALALAEARGASGGALIEATIAGYEMMGRLARALVSPELVAVFRPTPLVGASAAGLAAARVCGLDAPRIVAAAALATHTASGFNEWVHAGTGEHPFHAGFVARNGVTATLLADAGATAAPTILDGPSGLLAGFGARDRAAMLTHALGDDFEIRHVVHKPAPACFFVQAPCQLAASIVREHGLAPAAIDAVDIRATASAVRYPGCDNSGPMSTQQDAIMSLQFSVASVLVHGSIAERNWRDFTDPDVAALAARCRVVEDDGLTAALPRQGVSLHVRLANGAALEHRQDDFRSMSGQEVRQRFFDHASPVLGESLATRVLAAIDDLEHVRDLRQLTALMVRPDVPDSA